VAHRADIQGLRALAVLLVALGHAGVPFLRGGYVGVDVFFVLSGYLITGILLTEALENGRVSLARFYARRARRILPAAVLTLVTTSLAAHYLLNFVRAREVVEDTIWASLFVANTHFARQGSDYFEQGQAPSPILHFWSLSAEEQFYVVWPSILALALFGAIFGRRRHASVGRLLVVIVVAGLASLAWSIYQTAAEPVAAYFSTFTRAWELALGAGLAVTAASLRHVPALAQALMGWAGLAAVVSAAALLSNTTALPGYAALLPAGGAALLIAAGLREGEQRLGAGRLLSVAPLGYLGDRSYAFYLWHWPVLVIAAQYAGHELSVFVNLMLLGGALCLSVVSYALVENPLRRLRWPTPVGGFAWPASAAAVLLVAIVVSGSLDGTARRIEAAASAVRPSALVDTAAAASLEDPEAPLPAVIAAVRAAEREEPLPSPLTPPVGSLSGDFYQFPNGCTARGNETRSRRVCRLGDRFSSKSIVVIGDSHAQMWMPTILHMAQHDGWVVIPFVKVSCIPRTWLESARGCGAWYRWVKRRAAALRPDVTLIVGSWSGTWEPRRAIRAVAALSTAMRPHSRSVIVVDDPPGQRRDPTDCVLDPRSNMKTCSRFQTRTQQETSSAIRANARRQRAGFLETRGLFCALTQPPGARFLCPLVINKTITYIDRGHVSRTYALELAQPFRARFRVQLFG
jgi:peptidoglycan/LPS O-acetylase OafA/YrhL